MRNAVVMSGLIGIAALGSFARADLKIDLRFANGSKTLQANPGDLTPITINAWAMVKGAAGNAKVEGLNSAVLALQSQIISAGIAGSITSAVRAPGWGGVGSQSGTSSNLSADGIGDWGSTTNAGTSLPPAWFRARTTKTTNNQVDWGDANSPAGSTYHDLADGGAEFLVGVFTFTPTAMPSGASLKFNPGTPTGGLIAPATWFEDTTSSTASQPTGGKTPGTGSYGSARLDGASRSTLAFSDVGTLPEPASLGLIGLAGLAMLRRNRR